MISAIVREKNGETREISRATWYKVLDAVRRSEAIVAVRDRDDEWYRRITLDEMNTLGAVNLARGIVQQAAWDWRSGHEMEVKTGKASYLKWECEEFFRSRWFESLSGLDGKYMLRRLRDESEGLLPAGAGRRKKVIRDTETARALGRHGL